jgi:DoxX-like family
VVCPLFLLMDGVMKLVKPEPVVKATVQVAYPESIILGLGIVLLLLGEMLNDEAELHEYANSKRLSDTHSSQI